MGQTLTPETAKQQEFLPLGWNSREQMRRDKRQYMRFCASRHWMLPVYRMFYGAIQWDNS